MKKTALILFLALAVSNNAWAEEVTVRPGETLQADETDVHDVNDPWESFNRPMFTFNYNLDKYVLKPVAKGYRNVTTQWMRNRVSAALANIEEPKSILNYALQGKIKDSGISLGRLLVNTTLGLGGLFDVASGWGWNAEKTDFDQTLGDYCVPDGPFLVLPFYYATTPRAFAASFVDGATNPVYWATYHREDGWLAYGGYYAVDAISMREATLGFTDDIEQNSVDLYTTTRTMYLQNKSKYNRCQGGDTTEAYDFDFDE